MLTQHQTQAAHFETVRAKNTNLYYARVITNNKKQYRIHIWVLSQVILKKSMIILSINTQPYSSYSKTGTELYN